MNKKLKRITAAFMAVATLTAGSVGMTASAATVGTINLYKYAGAPGSATVTYQEWDFTTKSSTTHMGITSFTKSGSDSYVTLISSTGVYVSLYGTGSASATNVKLNQYAIATATLNRYDIGDHRASGTITG